MNLLVVYMKFRVKVSKSLTKTVSPIPPLLYLVLGRQHGAVPHRHLPEPLPLLHLARIIPICQHLLDDATVHARLLGQVGGCGCLNKQNLVETVFKIVHIIAFLMIGGCNLLGDTGVTLGVTFRRSFSFSAPSSESLTPTTSIVVLNIMVVACFFDDYFEYYLIEERLFSSTFTFLISFNISENSLISM